VLTREAPGRDDGFLGRRNRVVVGCDDVQAAGRAVGIEVRDDALGKPVAPRC